MKVLLDTHVLLWWMWGDPRLSDRARNAIEAANSEVYISAASAFEISTKVRIGKLPAAERLSKIFLPALKEQGFSQLPVTIAHALRAGSLPGDHRDPFDRLLVAQATQEGMTLVSGDALLRGLGAKTLW